MGKLSPNLEDLTADLPPKERADIEAAIVSSPYLRQIMTEAVNAGTLKHVRMGDPSANEGGHYNVDKNAIYLSPNVFSDSILRNDDQARLDAIASILGHETGHALHAEKSRKELYFTVASITDGIRAAGPGGEFDATGLSGAYIRNARRDEAMAEIHGWNALASRIEYTEGRPPSREEMLKRAQPTTSCVEGSTKHLRLAPGIVLDADMQMSDHRIPKRGPINLEAVAACHFDRSPASLGKGGEADYPNYYGAYLVQQLAEDTRDWVRPPTVKLDMARLGLDKVQLESTGLRLPSDQFYLIDISDGRRRPVVLRSTGSGMQGTPDDPLLASNDPAAHGAHEHPAATRDERQPSADPNPRQAAVDQQAQQTPAQMTQPGHPAHAMYAQACVSSNAATWCRPGQ